MLRKDVKLGFAIGGVMLAVVVVYVLVVPNTDKRTAQLVTEEPTGQTTASGGNTPANTANPVASSDTLHHDQPAVDAKSSEADANQPDNVGRPSVSVSQATTAPSGTAAKGDIWDIALTKGVIPPQMSATPTRNQPADKSDAKGNDKTSQNTTDTPTDGNAANIIPDAAGGVGTTPLAGQPDASIVDPDAKLAGDTQPANGKAKTGESTHVVKAGETLSSIAASAYGDAKAWKRIADANPSINPNRLSAGAQLVIPAAAAKAGATSDGTGSVAGLTVNPQTQYLVHASDSLYRISVRLYGKADHVQKLYDDNKDVIGADPRHLKLGMILKLTDPPVIAARS